MSSSTLKWFLIVATLSCSCWYNKHIGYASGKWRDVKTVWPTNNTHKLRSLHIHIFILSRETPSRGLWINFKAFNSCSLTEQRTTPTHLPPSPRQRPDTRPGDVIWTIPEHSFNCCEAGNWSAWGRRRNRDRGGECLGQRRDSAMASAACCCCRFLIW